MLGTFPWQHEMLLHGKCQAWLLLPDRLSMAVCCGERGLVLLAMG